MKFACPNCSKKYNLGEDKLAARSNVRLKCRQCGEQVNVKEDGRIVIAPLTKADTGLTSVAPPAMPSVKPADKPAGAEEEQTAKEKSKPEAAPMIPKPEATGPGPGAPPPSRPNPGLPPPVPPTRGASNLTPPPPPSVASKRPPAAGGKPVPEAVEEEPAELAEIKEVTGVDASSAEAGEFPKPGASVDPTAETPAAPEGAAAAKLVAASGTEGAAPAASPTAIEPAGGDFDTKALGASQGFVEDMIDKMKERGLDEKKRLLIVLGIGFLLGLIVGLIF